MAQAPNGVIYLFGPRGSNLHCAAFNEAWVRQGQTVPNAKTP
jgi:hypothetical protein